MTEQSPSQTNESSAAADAEPPRASLSTKLADKLEVAIGPDVAAKAGKIISPRTFSTGTILYGAAGSYKAEIESLEDARFHLTRMKAAGAIFISTDQAVEMIKGSK